jgi:hypothetical protein
MLQPDRFVTTRMSIETKHRGCLIAATLRDQS